MTSEFWFNVASVVGAVLVFIYAPQYFTPEVAAYWIAGSGIGNIVIRKFTGAVAETE